uniref:MARVEL domain-containing protein n=1 Tax=Schistocephalus solidus TaxID=70667 RepID=A0A0V0J535_SCHSO
MVDGGYATTIPGIMKIVGAILGFITMILIAVGLNVRFSEFGFILFVSIYVWIICLLLLLLHIFGISGSRPFEIFEAVALGLMVLFVFIAFIIAAVYSGRTNYSYLIAITVFFFAILVTSIVDLVFHVRKMV